MENKLNFNELRRYSGGIKFINPVQETSLEALESIRPTLNSRQEEVYEWLKKWGPANNTMIGQSLKRPINSITPRIKELRNKKLVIESHKEECPLTKRKTIFWKINDGRKKT